MENYTSTQEDLQMSFWELLGADLLNIPESPKNFTNWRNSQSDSAETLLGDVNAYLRKDTIISSVAKECFSKELKKIELSEVEELLFSVKVTDTDNLIDIVRKIARKVTRPLLRSISSNNDSYSSKLLGMMDDSFNVSIRFAEPGEVQTGYVTNKLGDDSLLILSISEPDFPKLEIVGTQKNVHSQSKKSVLYRNGIVVADLGEVTALLIILSQIKGSFQRFRMLDEEEKIHDEQFISFVKLQTAYYDTLKTCLSHHIVLPSDNIMEYSNVIAVSSETIAEYQISPLVKTYLQNTNPEIRFETLKSRQEMRQLKEASEPGSFFIITRDIAFLYYSAYFMDILDIRYHDLLCCINNSYWPYLHLQIFKYSNGGIMTELVCKMYQILHREKEQQLLTLSYWREKDSEYAKSYQQKKNIPKTVLAAMANSKFNNYFGYVELDESCDLKRVEAISNEFIAVKEMFLPFVDSGKNAIRFRRLGNHKAAGLYYPKLKCLCIDVRNPYSMIHEYGHLIDYELGNLSLQSEFMEIKELYRTYIQDIDALKVGGGKYNLDYYLRPTEIFARAFELYMSKVKDVKNSLLPERFSNVYCQSSEFLDAITKYFDTLFSKLSFVQIDREQCLQKLA